MQLNRKCKNNKTTINDYSIHIFYFLHLIPVTMHDCNATEYIELITYNNESN